MVTAAPSATLPPQVDLVHFCVLRTVRISAIIPDPTIHTCPPAVTIKISLGNSSPDPVICPAASCLPVYSIVYR